MGCLHYEINTLKRKKLSKIDKLKAERRMADLLFSAISTGAIVLGETYWLVSGRGDANIGYSSHLGGFCFGFLFMYFQ
jgi:membrane associated rhomboid family serine protease